MPSEEAQTPPRVTEAAPRTTRTSAEQVAKLNAQRVVECKDEIARACAKHGCALVASVTITGDPQQPGGTRIEPVVKIIPV